MEFKDRLKDLRNEYKKDRYELAKFLNVSYSTIAKYESGLRSPDKETLNKLANYFNVSVDYLLGRTDIRNPEKIVQDKLTEKDKKDIAKDLEKMMNDLEHADGLMFYNEPITDEDRELLKQALEFGLRMAKIKNKEKYTPKKYRK
ncbi:helix-turn-helix transcriptional regulator [Thermoanaerobacterium sp. R66]|uniref:helix-turn-helix domain-containing protein n=1 Tax=Thermoanaerobacterium sp. R66 TaxID=2742479 RepID=UPI002380551B|nr:helix-turn-helix transcriptional regulator [Thermoanaerobacterium sp. R66]MDE4542296.1 helix-turn-helix transcriptional regulator [Thermoanaerobacterium sp. R66]